MKNRLPALVSALLAAVAPFLLSACGSAEQLYRLNPDGPAPLALTGPTIGLGPVVLPGYVDRPELIFQGEGNQFKVPAKVRWAGTLNENLTRTLATDVGRRLGTGNVLSYPWSPGTAVSLQVSVDVQQFHAVSGGGALLDASWRVQNPASRRTLRRQSVSLREPVVGDGYDAVVTAESRLVARLADEIARSLRASR